MPSPRLGRARQPWLTPSAVRNAPLDAMRSHRVPIYPETFGPALQEMAAGPAPRVFLSSKMAQRQHVKDADGRYYVHDASVRSYLAAQRSAASTVSSRLKPPGPALPRQELAQALQDELWTQIHTVSPLPPPAMDRSLPRPGGLPQLEEPAGWPTTRRAAVQRARREDGYRELLASDTHLAEIMRSR